MSAPPEQTVRSFIALGIEPPLQSEVENVQRSLALQGVRWTRRAEMHVTLEFLGDVPVSKLGEVEAAMKRACAGRGPLRVTLQGLGCFPNREHPSVLWLGVEGDTAALVAMQSAIAKETASFVQRRDHHAYRPHLTIGRVERLPRRALLELGEALRHIQVHLVGEQTATAVHLMKSEQDTHGAKYVVMKSVPLSLTA